MRVNINLILNFVYTWCALKVNSAHVKFSITNEIGKWAQEIGEELYHLSSHVTRRNKLFEMYRNTIVVSEDGNKTVGEIAKNLSEMMRTKEEAVKRIVETAEKALNNTPPYNPPGERIYKYYNADDIMYTELNASMLKSIEEDLSQNLLRWKCILGEKSGPECSQIEYVTKSEDYYKHMPMYYDSHFGTHVNTNSSIVKVATNIYDYHDDVTNGSYWSESLDLTFRRNFENDNTLTWQYFASPLGYMRHFPAIQWSQEKYDTTYDFRMRSWYTEAMTSPKDIIILLDRSGSMKGMRRALAAHIVNDILDTLNDNDFVNIYTFTNTTEPLVDCFNDTLVQANEENLRLLRESLPTFKIISASDISIGLKKAFEILGRFRDNEAGSQCNQAIMLITEGLDYDYDKQNLFKKYNWPEKYYRPVRIFTYLLGVVPDDAVEMEWIACSNMGYYVNISLDEEVREKVLQYLTVMSRPINMNQDFTPIWSYLYVDLADRRLPNWLWKKIEGNVQRLIFLDYAKRQAMREELVFQEKISTHMLLKETHAYEKYNYLIPLPFNYTTTVSMPVLDRRENSTSLLGVAAVDVPIALIKEYIPYHKLGVNAYAFILTNNGYILMHPNLRPEFQNILKPTFNRVDMTEVELLDGASEPRMFDKSIVELRKNIVLHIEGVTALNVIEHTDNMKRILRYTRHYFYKSISPFSLVVALPKNYGFNMITFTNNDLRTKHFLYNSNNWDVHPERPYCKYACFKKTRRENILDCLKNHNPMNYSGKFNLLNNLIGDAKLTYWFDQSIQRKDLLKNYMVKTIFLATHSGLTRWQLNETFSDINSIDEPWYKRAVEENLRDNQTFIYSVPFEIIGYQYNTMVTVVSAVFSETKGKKAPAAVTGYQFNQTALYNLFQKHTMTGNLRCGTINLTCFILDNNGYVIISDEEEYFGNLYTGSFIGDIRPDIMYHLVKDGVYKPTRTYDYQGICYNDPKEENSSGTRFFHVLSNLRELFFWILTALLNLCKIVAAGPKYQSLKPQTLAYERLAIRKTVPTPCDKEMWLFTLGPHVDTHKHYESGGCTWPYVVKRIKNSNLLLLGINGHCPVDTKNTYNNGPIPKEIDYGNASLPCYIAIHNNYTRKSYMSCFNRNAKEFNLNTNRSYCGGQGIMKMY